MQTSAAYRASSQGSQNMNVGVLEQPNAMVLIFLRLFGFEN